MRTNSLLIIWVLLVAGQMALAAPPADLEPIRQIYLDNCVDCHGGRGAAVGMREDFPTIPDFTSFDWHRKRTDGKVRAAIKVGVGDELPAFEGEFSDDELQGLVKLIRSFAPKYAKEQSKPTGDFAAKMQKLHQRLGKLREEFQVLQKQLSVLPR